MKRRSDAHAPEAGSRENTGIHASTVAIDLAKKAFLELASVGAGGCNDHRIWQHGEFRGFIAYSTSLDLTQFAVDPDKRLAFSVHAGVLPVAKSTPIGGKNAAWCAFMTKAGPRLDWGAPGKGYNTISPVLSFDRQTFWPHSAYRQSDKRPLPVADVAGPARSRVVAIVMNYDYVGGWP